VHGSRGAIVLADGEVPARTMLDRAWPRWSSGLDFVVAADGGARHADAFGLHIDVWVGDGDSVEPADLAALDASGTELRRVRVDKDQTDTDLAVGRAIDAGVKRLVILGALGGPRLDHGLANIGLLASPRLVGVATVLYDERAARISLLAAPDVAGPPVERSFAGRVGDLVTLLPVGGRARGVTTEGLRFPLDRDVLELGQTRGVSNVRTAAVARVGLESGRLLVIETPVTVGA
jgi:thiamine pyrophosphokinase